MTYAFYYDAPGNPHIYALVNEAIGVDPPAGRLVHLVTTTETGLRHLGVWQSREQWESFRDERVRPAVTAVLARLGITGDRSGMGRRARRCGALTG
jgi:hypothetical protein